MSQNTQPYKFDKKKWKCSSEYRYEVIKEKDFFPALEVKSKKQIKKILGIPNFINDGKFVYCLDIPSKEDSKCKGSLLVIGFDKGSPYNVTVVNVEPRINK